LIEIQAKNVFFRVLASAIGEILVFSDDFKTAFLQHSYRSDVARCCPGENRAIYHKLEHPLERLSRQSSSPELPSKPIGDFQVFSIRIARDVTSDLSLGHDRPAAVLLRMQNFIPMGVEKLPCPLDLYRRMRPS
jgi:hypothetical protein